MAQEKMPFFSSMQPGQWGTPAELFQAYRRQGLPEDQARELLLQSLGLGSEAGRTPEQIEETLRRMPMSAVSSPWEPT